MLFMDTVCHFNAGVGDQKLREHKCRRVEDIKRQLPCVAVVQVRTAS